MVATYNTHATFHCLRKQLNNIEIDNVAHKNSKCSNFEVLSKIFNWQDSIIENVLKADEAQLLIRTWNFSRKPF